MRNKKFLALLLSTAMVMSMAACGNDASNPSGSSSSGSDSQNTSGDSTPTSAPDSSSGSGSSASGDAQTGGASDKVVYAEQKSLKNKEYGTDYTSLYEKFGKETSIADVIEDDETGFGYIERDGVRYELGLDFLSMAMVYNTAVPEGGRWKTEDDVYATWWKLYIQRWNYMLPELPLYANEYYDMYNAQIKGVTDHPTNPYWGPAKALIDWTSEKSDNSIILGDTTELGGKFRYANFGSSNPGAADLSIQNLTLDLYTVTPNKEGGYQWNDTVVAEHSDKENADGSKTYTIKLKEGLLFSDGSPVTAKNYVLHTMVFSTPVAVEAAGKDHTSGQPIVGFEDFNTYTGVGSEKGKKELAGLRMLDDLTFSVTIDASQLPYFYDIVYASFSPEPLALWIGDQDIKDDGNGVYFTDDFYKKTGESYDMAAHIKESSLNTDTTYPYSGPYMVESYDVADKSAVLKINPNYPGNYEGVKPSIETVVYKKVVTTTQLEDLKSGGVDVLPGITGGNATNEAIALADGQSDKFVYTHYSRAGYGKLGFRCDFGPVQFPEVRQAVAYCMDRAGFAKDFTGGYGGVQDAPYYAGSWMYKAAVEDGMLLNAYATSVDSAIAVLEEGGWVYDKDGKDYSEGVRYKKIPAAEAVENDINFQSKDGVYKTTKVGDDYYMPLVLNWYGTTDNDFSELLMTGFATNDNIIKAGFAVQSTMGTFQAMLDEQYQKPVYNLYQGPALYTCFNYATGFTSTIYDYAYNLTLDPVRYDGNWNTYFIKDPADAYWLK